MDDQAWELLFEDIKEMKKDIKHLIGFRGWVIGAACLAGVVGSLIVQVIK